MTQLDPFGGNQEQTDPDSELPASASVQIPRPESRTAPTGDGDGALVDLSGPEEGQHRRRRPRPARPVHAGGLKADADAFQRGADLGVCAVG